MENQEDVNSLEQLPQEIADAESRDPAEEDAQLPTSSASPTISVEKVLESSVSHSRSAETTGDSPLPLNHIDDGDDTTFSPSAAPSIPSSPRARRESHNELEEVKQAKLLEALQDNPAEYAQEHNLTLAERKTLAKMKFEKEKKEKLQMYLKVQDQSQEAEIDPTKAPERSAISDRFLQAKLNQQKAEEERLARIRNNPNRQLTRTVSVKDAWDNALDNANKEPDKSKKSIIRAGSVRNVWDNTLNESKEIEANRFLDTKRKTISQFRITEGTGFVRKKVNEWEEVFIQLAATAEEYDEFLRAAMMRIDAARSRSGSIHNMEDELKRQKEEQRKFQESSTIPEKFEIGATHIYSVKLLESHVASMLNKSLKEQKLKHLSLSCWVYGEQSKKPPIDVFAAVIRTDDKSMYVSLTIKASIGAELDPSVYGLKKVSVFLNELKVLDRLLEVVPMQGYEGWIAAGSYDIHATESQEQGTKTSKSREVIASISESDEEDLDVVDNEKILSEGEVDSMLTGLASSSNSKPRKTVGIAEEEDAPINEESELEISRFTDSTLDPANVSIAPLQDDERLDVDLLNDSTVMCLQDTMQMEDVAELSTVAEDEEGTPLKIESPLVVDGPDEGNGTWRMNLTPKLDAEDDAPFSEDTVNTDQIGEFGNQVQRRKPSTLTDDETVDDDIIMEAHEPYNLGRLMSVAHVGESRAFMPTHIEPEELYYGSRGKGNKANKYPWQLKDEAEDGLGAANSASVILNINDVVSHSCSNNCLAIQGHEFTTVFTGTLKSGKTDTKFIVDNDKIFEWVRGAAISGWLVKWPMKSQQYGRRSKRFFLLRDNLLSYHRLKPQSESEVAANHSLNSFLITKDTTIVPTRRYLMKALKVESPLDTLWLRLNIQEQDQEKWLHALNKSVLDQSRMKLFLTKTRIESVWFHESQDFFLRSVDAFNMGGIYVKVALFCLRTTLEARKRLSNVSKPSTTLGAISSSIGSIRNFGRKSSFAEERPTENYDETLNNFSVDIGTNDKQRIQLEVLLTNESTNIGSDLKSVQIYGEMLLFGGTNGFIGVGVIAKATGVNDGKAARTVMFCLPCRANLGSASTPTSLSNTGQSTKSDDSIRPAENVSSRESAKEKRRNSSISSKGSLAHNPSATILCFAVGVSSNIFVAADDENTLSIWFLEKKNNIAEYSVDSPTRTAIRRNSGAKTGVGSYYSIKPKLQCVINLSGITSSRDKLIGKEKVIQMHFLPNDEYLVVSTDRRLLLLTVAFKRDGIFTTAAAAAVAALNLESNGLKAENKSEDQEDEKSESFDYVGRASDVTPTRVSNADNVEVSSPSSLVIPDPDNCDVKFTGWVEIDRALPGNKGVFAFHVQEQFVAISPGATMAELRRKIVQWRISEEDPLSKTSVKKSNYNYDGRSAYDSLSECSIYRFEWTNEMFEAALQRVKPF